MPRKIITEELKQEIIKYYQNKPMTLNEVAIKFNLSYPTISNILKDIPKYPKAKINNPNLNERFFQEINSEEKAYFLGLLISDGNVFKDGTGRQASISITLDLNDEYLLQDFKTILNANTAIGKDGRGCGQIAVRSNIMAEDLAQYGVVPRKSYITYLPLNIDNAFMSHLIRGIFDGDGHIEAKINPKTNKYLHGFSLCGSHKLMEDIANYCFKELHLKTYPKVYDYKDRNLSDIHIQSINDMYLFGEWLYKDATIYMKRKKEIYDNFKQHYNLN